MFQPRASVLQHFTGSSSTAIGAGIAQDDAGGGEGIIVARDHVGDIGAPAANLRPGALIDFSVVKLAFASRQAAQGGGIGGTDSVHVKRSQAAGEAAEI